MALATIGGLVMIYLAIVWLDPNHDPIGTRPLLFYGGVCVGVGLQLVSLGILAELVTAYNIRPEDTYSVVERLPAREAPAPPVDPPSGHREELP
jgi:hypothetical protein